MNTQFGRIPLYLLLFFGGCSAQTIEFFDGTAHQGNKIHTSRLATSCEDLPTTVQEKVLSVVPARCVRLFSSPACSYTSKYVEIKDRVDGSDLGTFGNSARSFQACTEVESDVLEKRIKIYNEYVNDEGEWIEDMLVDHLINPNGCNALTTSETTSVDTQACVILYDGVSCMGTSQKVEPTSKTDIQINARSLIACNFQKPTPVEKIAAKVVKIDFKVDSEAVEASSKLLKDSIEGEEVFSNDGNVQVSQTHSAEREVEEVLNMFRPRGILEFDEVSVSPTLTITSSDEIPVFATDRLKGSFPKGFILQKASNLKENERFREATWKRFQVSQEIQAAPCSTYKVYSVVNVVQGYPVDYEIEAEIQGEIDDEGMNENQLKARLHGLEYVSTRNNSGAISVIAKASGNLTVDFGTGIEITGEGSHIEGCIVGPSGSGGAGAVSQRLILSVFALAGLAIYYSGRLAGFDTLFYKSCYQ